MSQRIDDAGIESKLDEAIGRLVDRLIDECAELHRMARKRGRAIEEDAELDRLLRGRKAWSPSAVLRPVTGSP